MIVYFKRKTLICADKMKTTCYSSPFPAHCSACSAGVLNRLVVCWCTLLSPPGPHLIIASCPFLGVRDTNTLHPSSHSIHPALRTLMCIDAMRTTCTWWTCLSFLLNPLCRSSMMGSNRSANTSYDSLSPATQPTVAIPQGCAGLSTPVWMAPSRVKPDGVFWTNDYDFYGKGKDK